MKTKLIGLLTALAFIVLPAFAGDTVTFYAYNDGGIATPDASHGEILVGVTVVTSGGTYGIGYQIQGVAAGSYGPTGTSGNNGYAPTSITLATGFPLACYGGNIVEDNFTTGTDGNGNPYAELFFHYQPVECTEDISVNLNDSWTNGIWVTITGNGGVAGNLGNLYFEGPLNNYEHDCGVLDCTNAPASVTYSNVPICMAPLVFDEVNSSPVWRIMGVEDVTGPGTILAETLVAPTNGVFYYSNSVPCGTVGNYHLFASGSDGDDNVVDTGITGQGTGSSGTNSAAGITPSNGGSGGSGSGSGGGTSPVANQPPPVINQPTNSFLPVTSQSTNGVLWSAAGGTNDTSVAGVTTATETGDNAIYNAINTAANQAHSDASSAAAQSQANASNAVANAATDANGIIAAINAFHADNNANEQSIAGAVGTGGAVAHTDATKLLAAVNGLTNGAPMSLTNYATETTASNLLNVGVASTNILTGISNLLSGAENGTNVGDYSSGTNVSAATSAVNSMFATSLGYMSDTITALTTAPSIGGDPGHTAGWNFNFCGTVIDLDPVDIFPSVFSFSYGVTSWLLIATYLFLVGKLYMEVVRALYATQTGGVPPLQLELLGTGGNAIGLAVAVIMPALFLGLWVVVVSVCVIPLDSVLGVYTALGTVFSAVEGTSSGAMASHVLNNAFPIQLVVQLTTGYLLLLFTMSKATLVASAVARFLFGK